MPNHLYGLRRMPSSTSNGMNINEWLRDSWAVAFVRDALCGWLGFHNGGCDMADRSMTKSPSDPMVMPATHLATGTGRDRDARRLPTRSRHMVGQEIRCRVL